MEFNIKNSTMKDTVINQNNKCDTIKKIYIDNLSAESLGQLKQQICSLQSELKSEKGINSEDMHTKRSR